MAGCRRRVSIFVAGVEIKRSTKHVEAASDVVSGLGFKSPRLQFVLAAEKRGCRKFCRKFIDCLTSVCSRSTIRTREQIWLQWQRQQRARSEDVSPSLTSPHGGKSFQA